jgi:hypothetical protein
MPTFPLQSQVDRLEIEMWGGGAIVWVGNRSGLPAGDGSSRQYPLSSVFGASGAIAKLASLNKVANRADAQGGTIMVLPGHSESITASTNLSTLAGSSTTGINIVGLGVGNQRPLFTWTAAASALLMNLAGWWFRNMRFNLAGTAATVVTAAITASAADCGLDRVKITPAASATQLTTTAMTLASGADRFTFDRVTVTSETFATNPTDIMTTTAAVDSLTMKDCVWLTAVNSTTNGVINLANAPTNVFIDRSTFNNKKAASTVFAIASASTTGAVTNTTGIIQTTGAATSFSTPGNLVFNNVWAGTIAKTAITIANASS